MEHNSYQNIINEDANDNQDCSKKKYEALQEYGLTQLSMIKNDIALSFKTYHNCSWYKQMLVTIEEIKKYLQPNSPENNPTIFITISDTITNLTLLPYILWKSSNVLLNNEQIMLLNTLSNILRNIYDKLTDVCPKLKFVPLVQRTTQNTYFNNAPLMDAIYDDHL